MGKLKDYFYNKKLDKWERMMKAVQNRINFNPMRAKFNINNYLDSDLFTRRIEEYKTWFTGNSTIIRKFYQSSPNEENLNYFWEKAPTNTIKRHNGVPKLIASKGGALIFGGDFKVSVDVYKNDNGEITDKINEKESKRITDTLNSLIDKMGLLTILRKQAVIDSWCGHSFGKLNYDLELSQYPIYETFDLTQAEALVERGIVIGYVFKSYYQKKYRDVKVDYVFKETYTTENDIAVIKNELFKLKDGKEINCPLTEIEETAELQDIVKFDNVKGMLAFGKPNILPNAEFPNSNYGASDYQGSIDSFDSADECYSELMSEVRNNKTIRYIPKTMIGQDGFNSFITNYQKVEINLDQNAQQEISIQSIQDKTADILNKYRECITTAINNAGLSPLALGITGLEAINAGEASQKERNRVTLETRKEKINNFWKPYLKDFFTQLLAFNNYMVKTVGAKQELDTTNISFDNCNIVLDFGNYVVEDETNVITRWSTAKQAGLSSVENAVREIHQDWSEEQILEEVTKIKFENNIGVDDPTLLQMEFNNAENTE